MGTTTSTVATRVGATKKAAAKVASSSLSTIQDMYDQHEDAIRHVAKVGATQFKKYMREVHPLTTEMGSVLVDNISTIRKCSDIQSEHVCTHHPTLRCVFTEQHQCQDAIQQCLLSCNATCHKKARQSEDAMIGVR